MLVTFPNQQTLLSGLKNDANLGDIYKTGYFREKQVPEKLAQAFAGQTLEHPLGSQVKVSLTMHDAGVLTGLFTDKFTIEDYTQALGKLSTPSKDMRAVDSKS